MKFRISLPGMKRVSNRRDWMVTAWLEFLCVAVCISFAVIGAESAPADAASSGTLSFAAIEGYWIQAGGPASQAATAAAITGAESTYEPGNIQQHVDYCGAGSDRGGWGLWQITCGNSAPAYGVDYQMLDPWNNAEAAVAKFKANGNSFTHVWTTFDSGAYLRFMPSAVPSPDFLSDPGQYTPTASAPPGLPSGAQDVSHPGSQYGPPIRGTRTASVVSSSGVENVFWRDGGGVIEHDFLSGGVWFSGGALASGATSDPTVIATANGGMDVFFASGSAVSHVFYAGSQWFAAGALPGSVATGGIGAVASGGGTENVFWQGAGGQVQHDFFSGTAWAAGGALTGVGAATSDPAPIATANGGMDVFFANGSGLSHVFYAGGQWYPASGLPGTVATGGVSAVEATNGVENVFWQGAGGQVQHDFFSGTAWAAGGAIAGATSSDAAPIATANGGMDVFYASGSSIAHVFFSAGQWYPASTLPGTISSGTPSAVTTAGGEDMFWLNPGPNHDFLGNGSWYAGGALPTPT